MRKEQGKKSATTNATRRREQSTKGLQIRSWRVSAHELPVLRIGKSPVQQLRVCAYCHDEQVHSAMRLVPCSTMREGREAHMRAGRSTDLAGENANGIAKWLQAEWLGPMYRQAKSPASFSPEGGAKLHGVASMLRHT